MRGLCTVEGPWRPNGTKINFYDARGERTAGERRDGKMWERFSKLGAKIYLLGCRSR